MFNLKTEIPQKLLLLSSAFIIFLCFPLVSAAQTVKNGETYWKWQSKPDKDNLQLDFTLSLRIKGKKARGGFSFINLQNGEWDGNDGNVVPFIGKVVGNTIEIEFDANDTRNREEYDSPLDAAYKKPKRASRATLKINKGKLVFLMTKGKFVFQIPRRITMRRMK